MNQELVEQLREFAIQMQSIMAKQIENTMIRQIQVFATLPHPMALQAFTSGMHNIMAEQAQMFTASMQKPMANQVEEFSASMQRIMAEQMQMFAASTHSPSMEEIEAFTATMRSVMEEQLNLTLEMQKIMTKQLEVFANNLQETVTGLLPNDKPD
ncbi:MAG: hypothetical protein GY862_16785 [Gammaproteobacteria bacterium]|nr:hypothetical protein [Gammaproteobacteria bacterium]